MANNLNQFSFFRVWGLVVKEFTQLKRDHTTFALIIGLPLIQLILFGMAINMNPRHLPTAVINADSGPFSRTLIQGLENTNYFRIDHYPKTEADAKRLIETHQVLFVLNIPPDYSRKLVRGEKPVALLEVDGTDPVSVTSALSASNGMMPTLYQYDLAGPLKSLNPIQGAAELRVHVKYNPSSITEYNIVPGLLGVVLTMTFVMVASMSVTKESELGTMESMLSTPLLPIEVIIGKVIPFLLVGYLQVVVVLLITRFAYHVPFFGSPVTLLVIVFPFILANLFLGIFFSTITKTQLEASQISMFFIIPSILMSGFAFPFEGMPLWARVIGDVLPMTHFNNIVRGVMLKGVGWSELWIDVWPMLAFALITCLIAVKRYRRTLD